MWTGWRGDMIWICGLSTICSHITAHNQLRSMPALSLYRVVFIVYEEAWFFVSLDFAVMWPVIAGSLTETRTISDSTKPPLFFLGYLWMFQIVVTCKRGKLSFIWSLTTWLKECSQRSMTSVIWHQRSDMDCLVVPSSPVCVDCGSVFFKGVWGCRVRLTDTREGESCFVDLVVHHSTHRLAFLNYAKLHLQWACQRLRLWAPA